MSARLLIIGIDALDALQIEKLRSVLPVINDLSTHRPRISLRTVYPPDSDTAWATIQTGMNPARHGVINYPDPLEKYNQMNISEVANQTIKGRTFWDLASISGKRVCVLLPHMGYPTWPVNGIMVGRSAIKADVSVFPDSLRKIYDFSGLNVVRGFPRQNDQSAYVQANERLLSSHCKIAVQLLRSEDWDLFFTYSSVLDMIQHYFWNLCDEEDPSYPGPNPFSDTIKRFYQLHDQMIGELALSAGSDSTIMVISDHGHGMRPIEIFNINQFLIDRGLLVLKSNPFTKKIYKSVEEIKGILLKIVNSHGLGNFASFLLKVFPMARSLYSSPISIDWEKTIAFGTNLSGVKAYAYSGIIVQKQNLRGADYENLRDDLIQDLNRIVHKRTDKKIINWILRREDLYEGQYIMKYPDIVYELKDGLGVGLTTGGELFGASDSHNLVPGSHKSESPIFLIANPGKHIKIQDLELIDIAPTICDHLNLDIKSFEGRSLFR